jgi:hypothetical protein
MKTIRGTQILRPGVQGSSTPLNTINMSSWALLGLKMEFITPLPLFKHPKVQIKPKRFHIIEGILNSEAPSHPLLCGTFLNPRTPES